MEPFVFLCGNANWNLARKIHQHLGLKNELKTVIECFPDNEFIARIPCEVSDRKVFILQSTGFYIYKGRLLSPNDAIMELAEICRAAKESGAESVIPVIPYFAYARQDRKDEARVPITASLVADILQVSGISQVILFDLHNGSIQGFFKGIRADHLYARPIFLEFFRKFFSLEDMQNLVIAYPDSGALKYFKSYSVELNVRSLVIDKDRISGDRVEREIAQEELALIRKKVKGRIVLIHDDMISTGGTITGVAEIAKNCGAKKVYLSAIHPVLAGEAFQKIRKAKDAGWLEKVFISDTLDYGSRMPCEYPADLIETISISRLLAEAILRIFHREPLSPLFKENAEYMFVRK